MIGYKQQHVAQALYDMIVANTTLTNLYMGSKLLHRIIPPSIHK